MYNVNSPKSLLVICFYYRNDHTNSPFFCVRITRGDRPALQSFILTWRVLTLSGFCEHPLPSPHPPDNQERGRNLQESSIARISRASQLEALYGSWSCPDFGIFPWKFRAVPGLYDCDGNEPLDTKQTLHRGIVGFTAVWILSMWFWLSPTNQLTHCYVASTNRALLWKPARHRENSRLCSFFSLFQTKNEHNRFRIHGEITEIKSSKLEFETRH